MQTPIAIASITSALMLLIASAARAQSDELQPGVRVRVTAPGVIANVLEVTVLARTGDSIRVGAPGLAPTTMAISRITSLEISRGSSRMAGAIVGMEWGVGIVGGMGAVIAAVATCPAGSTRCVPPTTSERVAFAATMAASGAIWGGGIGAIVGRETWAQFALPGRASLRASSAGVGLAFGF